MIRLLSVEVLFLDPFGLPRPRLTPEPTSPPALGVTFVPAGSTAGSTAGAGAGSTATGAVGADPSALSFAPGRAEASLDREPFEPLAFPFEPLKGPAVSPDPRPSPARSPVPLDTP